MSEEEKVKISFNGMTREITQDEFAELHLLAMKGYIEASDNDGELPADIDPVNFPDGTQRFKDLYDKLFTFAHESGIKDYVDE